MARNLLRLATEAQESPFADEEGSMKVRDIMTAHVELVHRRATLKDAAAKMAKLNIGALPVADRASLVGMITDRDIAVRGVAAGLDPKSAHVEEIMTAGVVECREDQDLNDAIGLMERHGLRRIVVVNDHGKPVGIISVEDLAHRAPDKQAAASAMHRPPNGKSLVAQESGSRSPIQ